MAIAQRILYLPGWIILSSIIYILNVGITVYLYRSRLFDEFAMNTSFFRKVWKNLVEGLPFEFVYQPQSFLASITQNPTAQIALLLCWRVISMFYFWVLFVLIFALDDDGRPQWYYYTNWNVALIAIYYTLAVAASIIGLKWGANSEGTRERQQRLNNFGYVLQILFEVATSTAIFITFVNFSILSRSVHYFNFSQHLITSVSLLVEMCLNSMVVRGEHWVLTLSWMNFYIAWTWIIVGPGLVKRWPYFFLNTSSPYVYLWTVILVGAQLLFYVLFVGLFKLKERYICRHVNDVPPHQTFSNLHVDSIVTGCDNDDDC